MTPEFAGRTDTGLVRSVNQDGYYMDPQGKFFIVADGMGGHASGDEASRLALEAFQSYFRENWDTPADTPTLIRQGFNAANQAILQVQQDNPEKADMGTTAVLVMVREEQWWWANLGDSRLYRWRQGQLQQLTRDHTLVARALATGSLSWEQAREHPLRHVLYKCLGREDLGENLEKVDVESFEVAVGDRLLLCSDGLTEEITDAELAECFQGEASCEKRAADAIELAKKRGGSDNITVIFISVPE
ncbi:PP2C family serine/threonine-protein phosphatase [Geitlerinema sp. PCC 9228]|uniref:PP2C family protein-serine/threonine phosphatase n=1 Tax=Geitlerinema sp. PCC 9228 TaxID=111611 RepID=UPI0008F9A4D2|nr:PP2C family serine/threonine-protein phosphatase [Geitlerinema sp. PCC 9228]